MENNLLLKYMNERTRHTAKQAIIPGPVITISRECGCSGRLFAEKLTEQINNKINNPDKNWKWVSKEVLNLASEELKIHPDQMNKLLKAEEKNFLDEIVSSFTDKYYVHDSKVKKVIEEVIRSLAVKGKAVLLGRGSEVLSHDIPLSLHVRLFAPLDWRANIMSERMKISQSDAKKFILKVDEQRLKFKDAYIDKKQNLVLYDIEFNCAKFSLEEMIGMTLRAAEIRTLI